MTSLGVDQNSIGSSTDVGVSQLSVGGSLNNGNAFNTTLTALAAPLTFVAVAGTWSLTFANGFTSPSNGVLQCNVGGTYRITMNGLVRTALANTVHEVALRLNGSITTMITRNSLAQFYSDVGGIGFFSTELIATLTAGDQLDMAISAAATPSNPRVFRYAINAIKL